MNYFFNISAGLLLVILQTAVLPYLPLLDRFYDILIPFVVFLSLSRPVRESLPVVFLLGFIMDNLSGSPFALYLTAYIWLFVGVRGMTRLLQIGNRVFIITLIVAAGVLVENLIFLGTLSVFGPDQKIAGNVAKTVTTQVLWAIWTGPIFFMVLKNMQNRLDAGFRAMDARRGDT